MYHYIDDKYFLKQMRCYCSDIINQLVQQINNDSIMTVAAHLVGSGAKNLITQNEKEPIDLDYNLCIIASSGLSIYDGCSIKEYIRKQFNIVLKRNGWTDCKDSTSVLSTGKYYFPKPRNQTNFSIDLAIVRKDLYGWHRLIHHKTGIVSLDRWYWNLTPNSVNLEAKITTLKNEHLWEEVREVYLKRKNMYLQRNDYNHPSFIVYVETINEVYNSFFRYIHLY